MPLPGGEPGTVLAERRVGTLRQRGHELQRPGVLQRPRHGTVVGVGAGQADVLGDRPREQMRPLRHPRDARPPLLQVQFGEVGAADPHPPLDRPHKSQQHVQQRRLARPARTDERHGLPGLDDEGHVGNGVPGPAGVADGDAFEGQGTGLRDLRAPGGRYRRLQHREDLLGRRQALRRRVVLGTHLPQRQIRLGRQHQDDQTDVQVHLAVHEPHADRHGDQGDGDRGQQLQREGGQEGDAQRPHRRLPVLTGDPPDRLGLCLGPAEHLQRRQARPDVQEVPGQPGQQPPLTVHPGLRGPADQHHEDRDQGERPEDDGRRDPVLGDDPREHRHRHHHGEPELRQIAREVVVQGIDPAGRQRHQRPRPLSA